MNRIAVSFFGFLNFFLLLRILPQTEYGIWMLFVSVTTVIELIKAGFIRNPLIKYSQEEDKAQIQSASFVLNVVLTLVISALLATFAEGLSIFWNQAELHTLFVIYILTLALLIPLHHFDYIQQANLHFKGSVFSEISRQLFFFMGIAGFYVTEIPLSLIHLALLQVFSVGISAAVSFIFARKHLLVSFNISAAQISKLFHYGKYTFGTSVSAMFMRNTDTWMLGRMMSPLAVAVYNPALRIANFLEIPALTLASILFPKLSRQVQEEGPSSASHLYEKSVGAILCCILPVVILVLLLAEPITVIIAGEEYLEAAPVLRITVLYSLLLPFNRQMGVMLEAIGKAALNFRFVVRNALFNVVFNYLFILQFGIIGAAYGTLLTYLISSVLNQIYLRKYLQVNSLNIVRYILASYVRIYHLGVRQVKL